jgi:hypothetical protein
MTVQNLFLVDSKNSQMPYTLTYISILPQWLGLRLYRLEYEAVLLRK